MIDDSRKEDALKEKYINDRGYPQGMDRSNIRVEFLGISAKNDEIYKITVGWSGLGQSLYCIHSDAKKPCEFYAEKVTVVDMAELALNEIWGSLKNKSSNARDKLNAKLHKSSEQPC